MSWFHDKDLPVTTDWYDLTTWNSSITETLNGEIGIRIVDKPYSTFAQFSGKKVSILSVNSGLYLDVKGGK